MKYSLRCRRRVYFQWRAAHPDETGKTMRFTLASKVVLGGLLWAATGLSPAAADTLAFGAALLNSAGSDVSESITFVATGNTSTLSFQGYQVPGYEHLTDVAVRLDGVGPNLLGYGWTAGEADSRFSWTFDDGSSVRGLWFGSLTARFSDIFSQAVPTETGDSYTLSFLYSDDPGASGLLVNLTNGLLPGVLISARPPAILIGGSLPGVHFFGQSNAAVPEPGTWALTLLGFAALGYAGRNRKRGKRTIAEA
jgi:hypothetical protein